MNDVGNYAKATKEDNKGAHFIANDDGGDEKVHVDCLLFIFIYFV